MAPCTFVVMLMFCLYPCCNALQNEKCNFFVVLKPTEENVTCFRKMEGVDPICASGNGTSSCQIDYSQGVMCLKWPADIELTCVNNSLKKLNEENKCARDQESISCSGEYQSGKRFLSAGLPRDSVSTLSMSKPLTTACGVMTFIHWMSLNPFF
ncbi:hypothetical protein R3I93_018111 [Phoxinus phoxinus]|uniref:Uncharacterized protein n=1 Tax=Phoxinus phoxinus TaxID=58324 RepID=A0AAN9CI34_9TELE